MSSDDARTVTQDVGDFTVSMQWPEGVTSGGPGVMWIEPREPDTYPAGGISSTVLRDIDIRAAVETLRRQLEVSERRSKARDRYQENRYERLREALSHGITPDYLSLLSSAYVSAVNHGQAKPLAYLAEQTNKTESAIKNHLWQASRKGLLIRSSGRPGGQLTQEATEILKRIVPKS